MGRRAKKAPVQTKKRVVLSKRFKCPFCANDNAVECKMEHRKGTGTLTCRICDASFQMPIHHLHEPIDVFSEWLDACEAAERGDDGQGENEVDDGGNDEGVTSYTTGNFSDDDDDDDLGRASGLGGGGKKKSGQDAKEQDYGTLGLDDSDDDST